MCCLAVRDPWNCPVSVQTHLPRARVLWTVSPACSPSCCCWTSAKVSGQEMCGPGALLRVLRRLGPCCVFSGIWGPAARPQAPGALLRVLRRRGPAACSLASGALLRVLRRRGPAARPQVPGAQVQRDCPRGRSLTGPGVMRSPAECEHRPLVLCSLLTATPKVPTTPVKATRASTFQEFESSTSDAWDAGEDDDELLAMAAESLNTAVVMETAHRVLRNHSQRQGRPRPPGAPEPSAEPSVDPSAAPGGDLRLVKSISESHASCPEGGGGGESRAGFQKEAWSPLPGAEGGRGEGSQPAGARRSSSRGPPGQQRQLRFLSSSWLSASPSRQCGRAGASVGCWGDPALPRMPWLLQEAFPA